MARRPLAGRDKKIIQGHRRDEFFARMRRKGGVPRAPNQAPETPASVADEDLDDVAAEGAAPEPAPADSASPAASEAE